MSKPPSPAQLAKKLEAAEARVDSLKKSLRLAETCVAVTKNLYAKARPLTVREWEDLYSRVASGKGICCEEGLEWLLKSYPEPWAHALNDWAYGALGCQTHSVLWIKDYTDRLMKLKLDRFPGDLL